MLLDWFIFDQFLEIVLVMLEKFCPERSLRVIFLTLFLAQLVLVFCHIGAIILDTTAPSDNTTIVRDFFELSKEGNAPTWFSSLLFSLIGFACGAIYYAEGHTGQRSAIVKKTRPAWLLFACLFLFLSFDETSQLHERLDWMISGLSEGGQVPDVLDDQGSAELPFYKYLLIYFPVLGALGLMMAWFVFRRFQQPAAALLFFVGMALLASKLLIESFEKWSLSTTWIGHSIYLEAVIVEMSCLFTGATLILTSLLNYLFKLVESAFMLRTPPTNAVLPGSAMHLPEPDPRSTT